MHRRVRDASGAGPAVPSEDSESGTDRVVVRGNYVAESQRGCLVAHCDGREAPASWLLSEDSFDPSAFGLEEGDEVPDLSVDPETLVLSVINPSKHTRSFFVTVDHAVRVRGSNTGGCGAHKPNEKERNGEDEGDDVLEDLVLVDHIPTTFVLVLRPMSIAELCQIVLDDTDKEDGNDDDEDDGQEIRVSSDVKDLEHHPSPIGGRFDDARTYPFPLGPGGPYLCSQGFGGEFTHFYPGTFHAVDFECPVGTPVLAVGDGVVVDVQQHNSVTGCHVSNLFKWNSVMLRLDDGVFVEYVHIRQGTCRLAPGDRVRVGDKLCETGDVGFCPTPHLHIQMHESDDRDAPTIKFALRGPGGEPYFPEAGRWYE